MSEPRTRNDVGTKETKRRVDGGPEEHKAIGALVAEKSMLVGSLHAGENCIQHAELAWTVLKVVHWGCHHRVKDLPWLV